MSLNPFNFVLRFLLEIAALVSAGIWGWHKSEGWVRFGLAIGVPLLIAFLWGTFRVPDDPGKAPVAVLGSVRLVLELAVFAFAVWALHDAGFIRLAWIMGIVVSLHTIISYDRILRLVKQVPQ